MGFEKQTMKSPAHTMESVCAQHARPVGDMPQEDPFAFHQNQELG